MSGLLHMHLRNWCKCGRRRPDVNFSHVHEPCTRYALASTVVFTHIINHLFGLCPIGFRSMNFVNEYKLNNPPLVGKSGSELEGLKTHNRAFVGGQMFGKEVIGFLPLLMSYIRVCRCRIYERKNCKWNRNRMIKGGIRDEGVYDDVENMDCHN